MKNVISWSIRLSGKLELSVYVPQTPSPVFAYHSLSVISESQ